MSCSGCEARREWINQRATTARTKLQLLLQRLGYGSSGESTGINESHEFSKRVDDSDRKSK
ncbi:hypothetical protein [Acinetobacter haemolyticus]|uniref:hypothetical protein n=1 Tax=Acinetobacter haemolyticus TaxID=29430 RepID=UPI000E5885BA|nr:hypothetical protein [Acinetobacter haemolyticus]QDJ91872.1 hypothetical protein AhaeAN54_007145 [Acinetobacter haemolyticus]